MFQILTIRTPIVIYEQKESVVLKDLFKQVRL